MADLVAHARSGSLGADLAWGEGRAARAANRSGVVALDERGQILNGGWTVGLTETAAWVNPWGTPTRPAQSPPRAQPTLRS